MFVLNRVNKLNMVTVTGPSKGHQTCVYTYVKHEHCCGIYYLDLYTGVSGVESKHLRTIRIKTARKPKTNKQTKTQPHSLTKCISIRMKRNSNISYNFWALFIHFSLGTKLLLFHIKPRRNPQKFYFKN